MNTSGRSINLVPTRWSPRRQGTALPCLMALVSGLASCAQASELAALRQQIEVRVAAYSSVDLEWNATTHFTTDYSRELGSDAFGRAQVSDDLGSSLPATFRWSGKLQLDGAKMRLEYNRPAWMFHSSRFDTPTHVYVFDGQQGKSLQVYSEHPFGNQGKRADSMPDHVFFDLDFGPLIWQFRAFEHPRMSFARMFEGDVQLTDEVWERRLCKVLRERRRGTTGVSESSLWLDPELDYSVCRRTRSRDGRLLNDLRIDLSGAAGLVLPTRLTYETYSREGRLLKTQQYEVVVAAVNQTMDPAAFELEFPSTTVVRDSRDETLTTAVSVPPSDAKLPRRRNARRVIVGANQREYELKPGLRVRDAEHLLKVVEDQADEKWSRWLGLLVLAAIVLLGSGLMWRRVRKQTD